MLRWLLVCAVLAGISAGQEDGAKTTNVKQFGSLQEAINRSSGELFVPEGTYPQTSTVKLKSGVNIRCAKNATISFTGNANGFASAGASNWSIKGCTIDTTATTGARAIESDAASSHILIEGNTFKGAAVATEAYGPQNGYVWLSGSDVAVRNNMFDKTYGVAFDHVTTGEVTGNTFLNYITGVYMKNTGTPDHDLLVTNNRFLTMNGHVTKNGRDAVMLEDSERVVIAKNDVEAALEHCFYIGDGSSHIVIASNVCKGWIHLAGIQVRGHATKDEASYVQDVTVRGNDAAGNKAPGTLAYLFQGIKGLTVSNNRAWNTGNFGFYINNVIGGTFTSNVANFNGTDGFHVTDLLGPNRDLTFVGNEAKGNSQVVPGNNVGFIVNLRGGHENRNFKFLGNVSSDTQGKPTQRYGFGVTATSGGSTLSGVEFVGNSGSGNMKSLHSTTSAPQGVSDFSLSEGEVGKYRFYDQNDRERRKMFGSIRLSGGSATLSGISPAFASASSVACTCTDHGVGGECKATPASGSSIKFTGSGDTVVFYHCVGQ